MTRAGLTRGLSRGLAVLGVVLAVLAVRLINVSRSELGRGDAAQMQEDPAQAILHYRRAARAYVPGNPANAEALDRLRSLGEDAEAGERPDDALAAYRAIRGAILATRHVVVPFPGRLAEADRRIARLQGETPRPVTLGAPPRPRMGGTLLALLGWLAWTAGAFAFARSGLDADDRIQSGPARLWGTTVVIGFGLFVIGLALA